ncbi:unnamed protein product [Paramecium primaurelia]|uniref:G domain-containing protein n=1 Tax=Paramecium primaurelia TaxID=5886 RepID=A0A8S1QTF0_PARPR|nr:unnamed protein product [Paramecium primaurelia]
MSIILLGQIGSGNTTLQNKITQSNEKTFTGGDSVTMNIFKKKSCFGSGFSVLDIPSYDSYSKNVNYYVSVLSALSEGPLNRLIIVVKFNQTRIIIEDVKKILRTFYNYCSLITVIITFWDLCEIGEKQENKRDIEKMLGQYKINSVLFFEKNDSSEIICQQIDQIIAKSESQNIILQEDHYLKNIYMNQEYDGEIFEIEMLKDHYIAYYYNFYKQAIKLIQDQTVPLGLQADYFSALAQFALKTKQQFIAFKIHFEMKNTLFKYYSGIVDKLNQKIYSGHHFSNYIKKCNYCNQIWLKTSGCSSYTVCGQIDDNHEDHLIKYESPPLKFDCTYHKEKLEIKPNETVRALIITLNEQNRQNLKTNEQNMQQFQYIQLGYKFAKVGRMGCKSKIDWRHMIPLTKDELNEVLGILDERFCDYLDDLEKVYNQRTAIYESQLKNEIEKKIQEQKTKLQKQ